jgi:hypothetical protein
MASVTRRQFIATSAALTVAATQSGGAEVEKAGFTAGVAVRDITPPPGVPMWGYSDRKGPSTGTLDPLRARALVLKAGEQTIAIVTMDLGRTPRPAVLDRIREQVKSAGITQAIFTASHTHGGPVMETDEAPHVQNVAVKLTECILEAASKLQPVKMGVSSTAFDVSHNRRLITADGKCQMLWRNEKKVPTSPVDREATVVKLETLDGKSFATVVHFACHPVVLGGDNLEYTADWVGEMCRIVKEKTGAECLYLQGGCGDINPYLDKTPRDQGGVESMHAVGKECADAVLAALPTIATSAPTAPSLAYSEKRVEIGTRWDFTDPKEQEVFRGVYGRLFDSYLADLKKDLAVPLAVLLINGDLALAFMPGELFTRHQTDLKQFAPLWPRYEHASLDTPAGGGVPDPRSESPRRRALLTGYSNDFHIYFPTIEDAAAGGYGGVAATYVGLGAGEKLVLEAQSEIGKLTGRLKDFCSVEDFQSVDAKTT